jgi:hypothetical protein
MASWSVEIPGKLVLSGRVLGRGGKPLCGAAVLVGADQAATDADGRFVLVTTKGQPYRVSFAGLSEKGSVIDARRDLEGTWRASFGLTLA